MLATVQLDAVHKQFGLLGGKFGPGKDPRVLGA
jgi:hypothetical protein